MVCQEGVSGNDHIDDIALNILNNLLIYDKLEDRNMDLNLEKVSALTFVIESVNHMKHLAEEKNIIVLFDVDSNFIKNNFVKNNFLYEHIFEKTYLNKNYINFFFEFTKFNRIIYLN